MLDSSVTFIESHIRHRPELAIVLGSGLGPLADEVEDAEVLAYDTIPGFLKSTVAGHHGRLVVGCLEGVNVAVMDGRFHLYEGHTIQQVVHPLRTLAACGAQGLIVSNASGGVNTQFQSGDVMVIRDHLNLLFRDLPDGGNVRSDFYDPEWIGLAARLGRQQQFAVRQGTYAAVLGPNYETRAEYRMLRQLGVDAVGMSTVPEVCAARQLGMRVLGLSAITNVANPDAPQTVGHSEVIDWANEAAPKMSAIIRGVLRSL